MSSISATGLRFRLMLLVVLAMLPMFGLLLYRATEDRNRKLHELEDEAIRTAEMSAGSVSQVIAGMRQLLFSLAYADPVRCMNGPAASAHFAKLLKNSASFVNIGLAKPDGVNIASALPTGAGFNRSDRPYFARLQQRRSFVVGEFLISKITQDPTLVLAYPLPDQPADKPLAAVYGALNLELLQRCIATQQLLSESVITVVDRNGIEVARNPDPAKWLGHQSKSWMAFEARNGQRGFVETAGVDGVLRLYYRVPVPGSDQGLFVIVGVPKSAVLSAMRNGFLRDLLLLDFLTLGALGAAWFIADYSVLRHVKRLTAASRQLAQGKKDVHARLTGGAREFQQLGRAFDEMASALREHRERLELRVEQRTRELSHANESLQEEIEERKQAQAVSLKLMANLERSNKELEQFAYVASHDLQEPLRLVSSYTQLLLQRYRDKLDAEAEPITKFITEGVTRMQRLIQDLLSYSRVSSQNKALSLSDAEAALDTALRNLAMVIREQKAVVTHDPLPTLLCDPTKLGQLFQNLISNGIKFRGEEPPRIHISVRMTEDESAWLFSVSDNGIGIEQEYFDRIFVLFQRLHTRSKYPGTGIGLAICKRIVEQHNGTIWVKSAKGKGCTFYFTIAVNPSTL
ncbi:MAG: ATP-binding protein [Verrucomicrobia bacterium]|nr:ATP-binding protein [Verrucomicrobiota bacterium]